MGPVVRFCTFEGTKSTPATQAQYPLGRKPKSPKTEGSKLWQQ
jgi:hypothetical protein